MPKLLDTGSSGTGWSFWGAFLRCPQSWAWRYLTVDGVFPESSGEGGEVENDPASLPRRKGSVLHTGLGHHYGIPLGMDLFPPTDAMRMVGEKLKVDSGIVLDLISIFKAYVKNYQYESWKTVAVEKLCAGEILDPTTGEKIKFTTRLDRVVVDNRGRHLIIDAKSSSRLTADIVTKYTLSGQFAAQAKFGQRLYGDSFGGIWIDGIPSRASGKLNFIRKPLPPTPGMGWEVFRASIVDANRRMKELMASGAKQNRYPRAMSEVVCMTPYGPCDFFKLCQFH